MDVWVPQSVEDGQQDETSGTDDRKDDTDNTASLLNLCGVVRQSSRVTEPSFRDKCKVEDDDCNCAASDEEWFEALRANI